ncbi:hypothetical protein NDU88_004076 [Pleurodeles waltl]|uniref:Uncharacterized protein n=1 Tax=Pleurodeles waltl TaxID=8319 RepID=A0AAV7MVE7_PLEWA|nr:hypothetical protein NDU88_004076 [Pleurodeles waltl]
MTGTRRTLTGVMKITMAFPPKTSQHQKAALAKSNMSGVEALNFLQHSIPSSLPTFNALPNLEKHSSASIARFLLPLVGPG